MEYPDSKNYILVVEDSKADFLRIRKALEDLQVKVPYVHIDHGDKAMDFILRKGEHSNRPDFNPSLILLDLNLPGLDGADILAKTRKNDKTHSIPVIMLTTSDDDIHIKKCYKLGANSYIVKPVTAEGFTSAIEKIKNFWLELASLPNSKD